MKIFKILFLFAVCGGLLSPLSYAGAKHPADHKHDGEILLSDELIQVKPNQAVLQIKGIVCSFCAYGVEKNLSKLPFIDKSQGKNMILTDIEHGQVTLSLKPGATVDRESIKKAVKKAGYDLVAIHTAEDTETQA